MKTLWRKGSMTVEEFLERKRAARQEPTIKQSVEIWLRLYPGEELAPDGLPYSYGPIIRRSA